MKNPTSTTRMTACTHVQVGHQQAHVVQHWARTPPEDDEDLRSLLAGDGSAPDRENGRPTGSGPTLPAPPPNRHLSGQLHKTHRTRPPTPSTGGRAQ